jgi:hypothetical protein
MKKLKRDFSICLSAFILGLLAACGPNIENAQYNVLFWFPENDKAYPLGVSNGLAECGSIAHGFAQSKSMNRNSGWSYICCMKTSSSECAEKHR